MNLNIREFFDIELDAVRVRFEDVDLGFFESFIVTDPTEDMGQWYARTLPGFIQERNRLALQQNQDFLRNHANAASLVLDTIIP